MLPKNDLPHVIADRIRQDRFVISGRWLERIAARVTVPPRAVFPTDDLLDHIPLLIDGIASEVASAAEPVAAASSVVLHARALGELRHTQGFSEHEILKEFEILGGILFHVLSQVVESFAGASDNRLSVQCAARLYHAIAHVQQSATARFLELARARVAEREDRLRLFNRALTHEMRNRIGATLGAGQLLQSLDVDPPGRKELAGVVVRNADGLRLVLENLVELTRFDGDARQQRHVLLRSAIAESIRQLREMSEHANIEIILPPVFPTVEVNAAVTELCLVNLLSNAIKYADPAKASRWIAISVSPEELTPAATDELIVSVEDNGLGISAKDIPMVFDRFFRSDATAAVAEGTGLGLSLVKEAIETVGGRVWVEATERGTRFSLSLPARRASDVGMRTELSRTTAQQ